jgi:RNA polymerase-interacting CarD/CdnL/TRCF family regulator
MNDSKSLIIGDNIIDNFQIYTVTEVIDQVDNKGNQNTVIYYGPMDNIKLSCSTPLKNFSEASLRKLITKEELKSLLKDLSEKAADEVWVDNNAKNAKEILYLNNPTKTAKLLKNLWQKKKNNVVNYLKSDHEIFEIALNHIIDEVALVCNDTKIKVKEMVMKALDKN